MALEDDTTEWESALLMGQTLEGAPYHIRTNEAICIMAVNYDPENLKYIPVEARTDMIVFTAIERDPHVAKYLTDIPNDRKYDLETIERLLSRELTMEKESSFDKETICASEDIRSDELLAIELVRENGLCIAGMYTNVRANREVALVAVENNWRSVVYLKNSLYDDYEIMMTALINSNYNADVFLMTSEKLRYNKSFIVAALSGNYKLFKYVPPELSCDNAFLRELLTCCDPHFIKYVQMIDLETLDMALVNPKFKICCCSKLLLTDKKVGLYMVSKRPELARKLPLYYCDENLLSTVKEVNHLPKLMRDRVDSIQDILDA